MSDPKSSGPGSGPKPKSFRELGIVVGALAVLLVGVAVFRPSTSAVVPVGKPTVAAPVPTAATKPAAVAETRPVPAPAAANAPAVAQAPVANPATAPAAPISAAAPANPAPAASAPEPRPLVATKTSVPPAASPVPQSAPAGQPAPVPPAPAQVAQAAAPQTAASPAAKPETSPSPSASTKTASEPKAPTDQARTSMKIQQVKSPGGIEAWLVEEHKVPLLALRFAFEGGNAQDPAGKEGIANFITAMLDEGAGDLDHTRFQERMEELAMKMSFEDGRDSFYGSFETLSANRDATLDMLRLAVTKPRFDTEAVDRIRQQLLANLAFAAKSPDKVAARAWSANAFPNHAYGRPTDGTPESVAKITRDDLETFRRRNFAKDNLRVVAVGDIDAKQLADILDKVFGDLPAKADLVAVPQAKPAPAEMLKVIEMDVPQSVVQFGMNGFARKDKDFLPAFVLNQILGGGGFASRLTEEVREKRGLAYSVYSYLQPYRYAAIFGGGVATKNESVAQSLDVIRAELKRMADDGPTETELANAKSYLTGSFALRFDTNAKIANQLLWMLQEEMGIDYVEKRNAQVEAVTMEDVKRAAKRLLTVDDLFVTVVGKPKGVSPRG